MDKHRCQSCGMPIGPGFYGTSSDGKEEALYCKFCYKNGAFTNPEQTLDGMIENSILFMTQNLRFPEEDARKASEEVIPKLKRWQT